MAYQLSSTSSAEKPGPMATINPRDPGGGGSVMVSPRISSTETDDRFPLLRRDFRVMSNASFGTSITFSTASITFGPEASRNHREIYAVVAPYSARKLRMSSPRYFSTTEAISTDRTIWNPAVLIFQPSTSSLSG